MMFSSCLVTKKYKPQESNLSDAYRGMSLKDTTSIAAMPWRSFFNDDNLKALIDEALENNFDLLIGYKRVVAAEAMFKQGKAEYFPSLAVNAEAASTTFSNLTPIFAGASFEQYTMQGSIGWEPDLWGRITANKNAIKASLSQSQEDVKSIQTALIANLSSAYYQLVKTDAQIELVKETIKNREESLMVMMELKKSGRVNEAGVMQTKAQLHATEALLIDFEQIQKLLENTINLMLGRDYTEIARSPLNVIELNHELQTGVPAQLLANRPDVRAAEFGLMQAFEQTNISRANMYPSITIGIGGGLQAQNISDLFSTNAFLWNAAAGLTQPIFNKRRNRTALEISKAQQEQATFYFQKSLIVASTEVSDALIGYDTATRKYLVKEEELDALNKAVSHSEALLTNGYGTYLEVLIARDSELSSQISLMDIKVERLTSMISLYQALGGGWR
ncbi:efflux transporter outer membrane subunit [Flammeovirga sp. SJP92]|uniref:efflux transporter outer membrane subunit n=1 Tax=Flammeovirga sp. SJP92 TaxID=1775430 RepID=UPI00156010A1|nr:efflux transporter outer membrane subunit [Flammeovirga sp. SJP92]